MYQENLFAIFTVRDRMIFSFCSFFTECQDLFQNQRRVDSKTLQQCDFKLLNEESNLKFINLNTGVFCQIKFKEII